MRVIFLEDVPGTAQAGDVKEVKNGYARNFLLPRKLAATATHDHLQRVDILRKVAGERRIREEQELTALVELLSQVTVSLTAKMSPTGRFYGAITSTQIADELSRATEREIDRRIVHLEEPIHEPGEYQVELRFAHGIVATIQAKVRAEGAEEPEATQEEAVDEVAAQPEEAVDEVAAQPEEAVDEVAVQPEEASVEEETAETSAQPEATQEEAVDEVTVQPEAASVEEEAAETSAQPETTQEEAVDEVAVQPEAALVEETTETDEQEKES